MKRVLSVILAAALFFSQAYAEESTGGPDEVVDIVTLSYSQTCMAALMADGTVRITGYEGNRNADDLREAASWTDIIQLAATASDFFGLKSDGSVVTTMKTDRYGEPLEDPFDASRWTNVRELLTGEYEYYGLTNDGRVLVSNDSPEFSFGGGALYLSWTGVEKLCYFVFPEARALIGLHRDGTVLRPGNYYPYNRTPEEIVDIDSSGYIECALCADGTICVSGPESLYAEGFADRAAALKNVEQIAVSENAILCRLRNSDVTVCTVSPVDNYPSLKTWKKIRDVQTIGSIMLGLDKNGRIHTAVPYAGNSRSLELCQEVESWTDIIRMKACKNLGRPYILGWQEDGTVLAAGLDISGLTLNQKPSVRYTDALVISLADAPSGTAALRDDGTVACAGLPDRTIQAVKRWRGITQLCAAGNILCGLRDDGYIEAAGLSEADWLKEKTEAEIEKILAWTDVSSIVSTGQRIVGLKKDGSILVGGPEHFGTEEKADFSEWTGIFRLEGGNCIGGEYLVGIRDNGIIKKGASLVGEWYGTPRRVTATACSGFGLLCREQDGTVSSIGFPGVTDWFQIEDIHVLDGIALGLRRDRTVAVDANSHFPDAARKQIESWEDIRSLSVSEGGLIVGVTLDGRTLVAESDKLIKSYGQECIDAVKSWTNLDRILGTDSWHHVLALRTNGTLVSFGLPLP